MRFPVFKETSCYDYWFALAFSKTFCLAVLAKAMNFIFRPDILYWNMATEDHDIVKLVSKTESGVNT